MERNCIVFNVSTTGANRGEYIYIYIDIYIIIIYIYIYIHLTYRHLAQALALAKVQRSAVVLPSLRLVPSIAMDAFIALLASPLLLLTAFFAGLAAGWLLFKILDVPLPPHQYVIDILNGLSLPSTNLSLVVLLLDYFHYLRSQTYVVINKVKSCR